MTIQGSDWGFILIYSIVTYICGWAVGWCVGFGFGFRRGRNK